MMFTALMASLLATNVQTTASPPAVDAHPIPLLLISGENNHDWRWTTPSLERILEGSGRFDVDVSYEPGKDLLDAERLGRARAIVLDYNGADWGDAANDAFLTAVKGGTGVVVIHAANNHGVGWAEYEKLVGDLWRAGTGHGRFHTFDVEVVDRDHPITRSLPTILKHPDELYHRMKNPQGVGRRVLASAFSNPETGGTGEREPMAIVKTYGEGRIFHTPLGHVWSGSPAQQASHRDPQFQGLLLRGTEWAATGHVRDEAESDQAKSDLAAGWRSLMDASSWKSFSGSGVPAGWRFDGETIMRSASAGDLVTQELFEDFDLRFEWKTTIAGNSGVKYRVPADAKRAIGPEYQLLDAWSDEPRAEHRAGAIYDVVDAQQDDAKGTWGEYRSARIVARGSVLEHYLDGVLVARADTASEDWKAAVTDSKFKDVADFAAPKAGRILLQDHGDEVWIRRLRIRRLDEANATGTRLFPAAGAPDASLWSNVGDATYEVTNEGTLIGRAGPARRQSFLVSEEEYGDFVLNVDVKIATLGNSGIQLRSHVNDKGRLQGYQSEIDPTERSWSGGIFDEGRRGWLDDLSDRAEARAAFDLTGWNRYRIECQGPRIRTWVNGVPAANLLDGLDLSGSLGFQIHGGDDDIEIHWRGAHVEKLGRHEWRAGGAPAAQANIPLGDLPGVRMTVTGDAAELALLTPEGALQHSFALGSHGLWRQGAGNQVTVLRDRDRFVVQLGDKTAHDANVAGVGALQLRGAGDAARIEALWTCSPVE